MSELTADELKWLRSVQRAINKCPSARVGFYVTGQARVSLYDRTKEGEINAVMDGSRQVRDFAPTVYALEAEFDFELKFPSAVRSTAA